MTDEHIDMADMERLAGTPEPQAAELAPDLRESVAHLRACPHCSDLLAVYSRLLLIAPLPTNQPLSDCPPDEQWFAFASGTSSEDETAAWLEHARSCPACSEKLRILVEIQNDPVDADQDMSRLKSSVPAWQNRLAHRMSLEMAETESPAPEQRSRLRRWWTLILVPAGCCMLAAAAIVSARLYLRNSDSALLARAYNERRLTDLYLPGGQPVAVFSPTLGQSETDDVLPLLKLRERAQQHIDRDPNDAYWQQMLGRIALVERNGDQAEKKFHLAQSLNPTLPGIEFDLASAEFEKSEADQPGSDFSAAANLFGVVIDNPAYAPLRGAAYYNRALCWARAGVYALAVQDMQSALSAEKNPAWRRQMQSLIEEFSSKELNSEGQGSLHLDTSPAGYLRAMKEDPQGADANYEVYLDRATRDWLMQRDPEVVTALHQLASIGLKHHDAWLRDFLGSSADGGPRAAVVDMAEGLQANVDGQADRALPLFTTASGLFLQSHNRAAWLRTQTELLYTYQRIGRSDECVRLAAALESGPRWPEYAWLNAYELLEASICRAARGDSAEHLRDILLCIELSRAARLPVQVLRERGMLVETLGLAGRTEEALRTASSGLQECALGNPCTPMRAYQFQQSLVVLLQERKLRWAAADAAEAAAQTSRSIANLQIRAYAEEVLGEAETAAGHASQARDAFDRASALLNTMPDGRATALYRADWQSDRSMLLELQGDLPLALQRMRDAAPQIAATDNFNVRQRHYTRMAALLLDSGNPADALRQSFLAVADAEHALAAADNETERLSWEKTYGRGYRLQVESLVAMGRPRESLLAWEWYRTAPYRPPSPSSDPAHPAYASMRLPSVKNALPRALIIIGAQLENTFVVWSVAPDSQSQVRMVQIGSSPQRIAQMAQTFTELCSDRYSTEDDIGVLGGRIYRELLSPFEDQMARARLLALDVDGDLQRLPFAALTRPDHRYLIDTQALVFLPAWWTLRSFSPQTLPVEASALIVAGSASLPASDSGAVATIPPQYFDSADVAEHFSRYHLLEPGQASVAQVLKRIGDVDVFHFNGHTFTASQQTGLLLQVPGQLFTAADLRGVSLRRCRLAVLAACSTAGALGQDMEDSSNLAHAFLTAGAANVVVTLWDVEASASRAMMVRMYDSLVQSVPVASAVQSAQIQLRAGSATNHPYFWSAVQDFTQ